MVYNIFMEDIKKRLLHDAGGGVGIVMTLVVVLLFGALGIWLALTDEESSTWWILSVIFIAIAAYCVYKLATPQKNKIFRKYESVDKVAAMINELLSSEKIYEDKYLMISDKYIMSMKDSTTIRKLSDILAAYPYTQSYNFVPVAGGLRLVDKWGDIISIPSGISTAKARDVMERIAPICPKIALGYNAATLKYIKDNKIKLSKG